MKEEGETMTVVETEEDMIALGAEAGERLRSGDVLGLVGDLGSGKTHFVKGIVAGLESPEEVTSPTFTLVHEYRAGRLPVHHFDLYRLESAEELLGIGWDEYIDEGGGVVVVEWAEKFADLLPENTQWWFFEILEHERRGVSEGSKP